MTKRVRQGREQLFFNLCELKNVTILCHLSFERIPAGNIPARRGFIEKRVVKYSLWSWDHPTMELFCPWRKEGLKTRGVLGYCVEKSCHLEGTSG